MTAEILARHMKWNNLTEQQYTRLCECRSKKSDIVPIAKAYAIEQGMGAEDALETALEHLDANGQFFDLTHTEWLEFVEKIRWNRG